MLHLLRLPFRSVCIAAICTAAWLALAGLAGAGDGEAAQAAAPVARAQPAATPEAARSPETVTEMFNEAALWIVPVLAGVYLILRFTAGRHPGD